MKRIEKQIWFLHSIILVALLTVALLFSYSYLFLAPSYTKLIEYVSEREAVKVANFIQHSLLPEKTIVSKESLPPNFEAQYKLIAGDFDFMKIKLFTPTGETIFSTDPKELGVINTKEYFHTFVQKGHPYTKIVKKNSQSLEGQLIKRDVIETYIPLMDGQTFLGAFEIYLDRTASKARLDHLLKMAHLLMAAISLGLLVAMFILVRKAKSSILARQRAEDKIVQQSIALQTKNRDLSMVNALAHIMNESTDINTLLPDVLEQLVQQFAPSNNNIKGVISLLEGDHLRPACHFGFDDDFIKKHTPHKINACLCAEVVRKGEIMIVPEENDLPMETLCAEGNLCGHILVPLKNHREVIGVLSLHAPSLEKLETRKSILMTIGNQLGLVITNITLFMETQKNALTDPLTGVGNRRNMDAHLNRFISEARRHKTPLSAAMIDIDFFKKFNDTFGHAEGDVILAKVASILKDEVRDVDFVARYGGEEFLILFSKTDSYGARQVCDRIRMTVEKDTTITVSIGLATFLPDNNGEEFLKEADNALYQAKKNGRNRVELSRSLSEN